MKIKFNDLLAMIKATDLLDLSANEMMNIEILPDAGQEQICNRVKNLLTELSVLNMNRINLKEAITNMVTEYPKHFPESPKPTRSNDFTIADAAMTKLKGGLIILDYTDLMKDDNNTLVNLDDTILKLREINKNLNTPTLEEMVEHLESISAKKTPEPKTFKLRKTPERKKQIKGKYLAFIRDVYDNYKDGLGYMDMVELLYTGKVGEWNKQSRKDCRGYGSTNLCGRIPMSRVPYYLGRPHVDVGILPAWFIKKGRKYFPNENIREYIMSDEFKPFGDQNPRTLKKLGLV